MMGMLACATVRNSSKTGQVPPTPSPNHVILACDARVDLTDAIGSLSSADSQKRKNAREKLLSYAKDIQCKRQIIKGMMNAMDKPDLDFRSNQSDYYLWLEGSQLLGDLRAAESLDLLISHLDLNNGLFSASMKHQPAVVGVIGMGSLAVPKLVDALRHNQNRDIRQAAAFCLSAIEGRQAGDSLRSALKSETDSCVIRMIKASLDLDLKESKTAQPSATRADIAAENTARKDRLLAFWCK
jgi:HEAT repeat protein